MLNKDTEAINNMAEKLLKSPFISKLPLSERYKKQTAFTLAEVLITLLIIGIVASMVIPAIIRDTQNAEFKVAYKKAYAIASNVTKQALANGEFTPKQTTYELGTSQENFNIFKSYFSIAKDCSNNNNNECWDRSGEGMVGNYLNPSLTSPIQSAKSFIDSSGVAWSLYSNSENIIIVDTNGFKRPNHYGKDRWIFTFKDINNVRIVTGLPSKIAPYTNYDVTDVNTFNCHYPPCYFKSWILQ